MTKKPEDVNMADSVYKFFKLVGGRSSLRWVLRITADTGSATIVR